jgi:type IV pilus assembly protein PilA
MNTYKNNIESFSLVELMVVIAIIGILAAIAIPSYQVYSAQSKFTDALSLAEKYKIEATDTYNSTGAWPDGSNRYFKYSICLSNAILVYH